MYGLRRNTVIFACPWCPTCEDVMYLICVLTFQKVGNSYVKLYKYELLRHMVDLEDVAAWLIVWSLPVGRLTVALRNGGELDVYHEEFDPVYEAGYS